MRPVAGFEVTRPYQLFVSPALLLTSLCACVKIRPSTALRAQSAPLVGVVLPLTREPQRCQVRDNTAVF
jgi:hypothetical protein